MEHYRLTATEAVAKVRSGELTVEAYARSLLSRVEKRDPVVRAWAYLDPEHVIRQAAELDKIPLAHRGPLHGLVVGVKDIFYTKDMPTQMNSPIYKGSAPQIDAGSVAVLRQAGALIFGKTTTSEFAAVFQGPATRNPHDASRTPGGSSSGSGAAVGDAQVPVALGSQTAGSIVRPASFNGVYGFKTTWGAVTREGQKVHSLTLDTFGLFARCVDDLELVLDALAVHDDYGSDLPPERGVAGLAFAVARTSVWPAAGPGTVAALDKAAALLRAQGATVTELVLPPEFDALPAWHQILTVADGRASFLPEYRAAPDKLAAPLRAYVETPNVSRASGAVTRAMQLAALDGIAALRPRIDVVLCGFAAVLTPSVVDEAPVGDNTGSPAFNSIWTALHVPVVNVPGFCGSAGMPVGISLVAPRFEDRRLLCVARNVGRVFEADGGWNRVLRE